MTRANRLATKVLGGNASGVFASSTKGGDPISEGELVGRVANLNGGKNG